MAGHSHWAKVKRYKGPADVKRGALFSKLSKEITIAAKMGGGDPNFNPRLRTAIAGARAESMPMDKIENAVNKGMGKIEGGNVEEIIYEGYAPGGVALLVEAATDNKNRTAAEVRSIFTKNNGNLGGGVAWMFTKVGLFLVESDSEDAALEATLDAGADDVKQVEGGIEVVCPFEKYDAVEKALKSANLNVKESKITRIPSNTTPVPNSDTAEKVLKLIELIEEHEDVQNVYANYDISDEILSKLQK